MDTPDLALPRTESAERCHECERARSERNEDFSPIIHYVPLGAIMPASPTAAAGEFLMKRSAVDLVIDCQIGGRFSTSAFGRTETFGKQSLLRQPINGSFCVLGSGRAVRET